MKLLIPETIPKRWASSACNLKELDGKSVVVLDYDSVRCRVIYGQCEYHVPQSWLTNDKPLNQLEHYTSTFGRDGEFLHHICWDAAIDWYRHKYDCKCCL
jgi:hypothetical protein